MPLLPVVKLVTHVCHKSMVTDHQNVIASALESGSVVESDRVPQEFAVLITGACSWSVERHHTEEMSEFLSLCAAVAAVVLN